MVDNLYLQLAGRKTFRLFEPSQGGDLYPYPWHHPMDRSAQVDLGADRKQQHTRYPRFAEARCLEVTLQPGDLLWLPAYWWHEVVTVAPAKGAKPDELVVSVNFWFSTMGKILKPPSVPLALPMLHVELAQQVQMVIGDALFDRVALVPTFIKSMRRALEATIGAIERDIDDPVDHGHRVTWSLLHKRRPADVRAADWEELFVFIVAKLCLWLRAPADLLDFFHRYLDSRFDTLVLRE